jgi:hypothetical protein
MYQGSLVEKWIGVWFSRGFYQELRQHSTLTLVAMGWWSLIRIMGSAIMAIMLRRMYGLTVPIHPVLPDYVKRFLPIRRSMYCIVMYST